MKLVGFRGCLVWLPVTAMSLPAAEAHARVQEAPPTEIPVAEIGSPITISFSEAPIREVLFAFAEFANRSIVPGSNVGGLVSAEIRDQPWDVALRSLLDAYGFVAHEEEGGIIRVDDVRTLFEQEAVLPLATKPFRVNYADPVELQDLVAAMLTERGRVSVGMGTSTLVVTDVPRVIESVGDLLAALDTRVRQVDISAKIIFVNRSALEGFGVTYDLKDTRGNQLNLLTPGVDRQRWGRGDHRCRSASRAGNRHRIPGRALARRARERHGPHGEPHAFAPDLTGRRTDHAHRLHRCPRIASADRHRGSAIGPRHGQSNREDRRRRGDTGSRDRCRGPGPGRPGGRYPQHVAGGYRGLQGGGSRSHNYNAHSQL